MAGREDEVATLLRALIETNKQQIESNAKLVEAILGARGLRTSSGPSPRRAKRLAALAKFEVVSPSGWQADRKSPIYGLGEIFASPRSAKVEAGLRAGHLRLAV